MKFLTAVTLICISTCAWAAPYGADDAPAANEARAMKAMKNISTGPWVRGDWALRAAMSTGKGAARVSVPMEIVGGWNQSTGRWQRIKLGGRQWMLKGAQETNVWQQADAGGWEKLDAGQRMEPMSPRVGLNWELYSMNWVNWPKARYLGVQKAKARWCDAVELTTSEGPWARAVMWIDIEFGAPLEAEVYDREGRLVKTVRAVSVQKTDSGEWILRRWEVVDGPTRQKVSLEVEATATGGVWDGALWNENDPRPPAWPSIPEEAWRRLE